MVRSIELSVELGPSSQNDGTMFADSKIPEVSVIYLEGFNVFVVGEGASVSISGHSVSN